MTMQTPVYQAICALDRDFRDSGEGAVVDLVNRLMDTVLRDSADRSHMVHAITALSIALTSTERLAVRAELLSPFDAVAARCAGRALVESIDPPTDTVDVETAAPLARVG